MANYKHHWDKKHKPTIDPNAPKNWEEAQEQFNEALAKAAKNPANHQRHTVNPGYMMRDGVPHKFKDGNWIPLTKMS